MLAQIDQSEPNSCCSRCRTLHRPRMHVCRTRDVRNVHHKNKQIAQLWQRPGELGDFKEVGHFEAEF